MKKQKFLIILLIIIIIMLCSIGYIKYKNNNTENNYTIDYEYIGDIYNSKLLVSDGSKYNYININNGKKILENDQNIPYSLNVDMKSFLETMYFFDDVGLLINENNKYGIIDSNGNNIISCKYNYLNIINKNTFIIMDKNKKYKLIDNNEKNIGNILFDSYEFIDKDNRNYLIISINGKKGLINSQGNLLIECLYDDLTFYIDNDKYVFQGTKNNYYYHYILGNDKISTINSNTDWYLNNFYEDTIYFKTNNKHIIYSINNNKITNINYNYTSLKPFNSGLSLVSDENNKAGFINSSGNIIIPLIYDAKISSGFNKNGLAIVSQSDKFGIINTEGNYILEEEYENITILNNGNYLIKFDGEDSILDKNLKEIYKDKKLDIITTDNDKYLITKNINNKLKGLIDTDGNKIIDTKYKQIDVYSNYAIIKNSNNKYKIMKLN